QELVGLIAVLGRSKRMAFLVLARHSGLARSGLHQMEHANKLTQAAEFRGRPKARDGGQAPPPFPCEAQTSQSPRGKRCQFRSRGITKGRQQNLEGSAVRARSFSDTACVRSRRRFKLGGAPMEPSLVTTDSKTFMR